MQDNDPRHTSARVALCSQNVKINWWKTPAQSPDLNLIENLWRKLKEYITHVIKPKSKDELVAGILDFWETVDISKCKKYIDHLRKVPYFLD